MPTFGTFLKATRADPAASPFQGENHREVWARMYILYEIGLSHGRVLRLLRMHHLLPPHQSCRWTARARTDHLMVKTAKTKLE